jgi:hypothetical protein
MRMNSQCKFTDVAAPQLFQRGGGGNWREKAAFGPGQADTTQLNARPQRKFIKAFHSKKGALRRCDFALKLLSCKITLHGIGITAFAPHAV